MNIHIPQMIFVLKVIFSKETKQYVRHLYN